MKNVTSFTLINVMMILAPLPQVMAGQAFDVNRFAEKQLQVQQILFSQGNNLTINSEQAASQLVKSELGGKVLRVSETTVNGNPGYTVKLLKNNGHVVYVNVDAVTGRIVD